MPGETLPDAMRFPGFFPLSHMMSARKRSTLAGVNWRRGILLAGIHLAVAVPLIFMLEVRGERNVVRESAAAFQLP